MSLKEPIKAEISIPFISICTIICILCCTILFYQTYCLKRAPRSSATPNAGDHLVTICVISCTLCTISDLTRWIIGTASHKGIFSSPLNQIMTIADGFYYIACICFYSIAVSRIYYAFKDSFYEISSRLIKFFIILISISGIAGLWHIIMASIQPKNGSQDFFQIYGIPAIIVLSINDFILNTGLISIRSLSIFMISLKCINLHIFGFTAFDGNKIRVNESVDV